MDLLKPMEVEARVCRVVPVGAYCGKFLSMCHDLQSPADFRAGPGGRPTAACHVATLGVGGVSTLKNLLVDELGVGPDRDHVRETQSERGIESLASLSLGILHSKTWLQTLKNIVRKGGVGCENLVLSMGSEGGAKSFLTGPLEVEEFRKHAHQMVDFIADYHRDVENFPVRCQEQPGYLQRLLPESAPEEPEALEDVFADLHSKIIPGLTHWQSPNFYGYYPCNASTAGFLGEMLCGGLNVNGFSWITSPAATELEIIALDWLGKLLQLPEAFLSSGKGGGVIQGTASEAVLVVLLAARRHMLDKVTKEHGMSESEALSKFIVYTSDQAHSSVHKGCQIAGICLENLRLVKADSSTYYALSPALLAKTVAADVAAGLIPLFLCATVGTTSSAAVDPISELGVIAQEYGMWFHVDGAYAGNACICPEYRQCLNGIEKADSFNMNPHKWLLTNFDCSTLWVKDANLLVGALSVQPEYLRNKQTDSQLVVDYRDWQIPLGRRFRSLKLWMVMRLYGKSGLQSYIRKHCELGKHFEGLVQSDSRFEVMAPTTFSLTCFRLKPNEHDPDHGNNLNAALEEAVNSDGNILITHTVLAGVYTLRVAIGGARTELRHVDAAWKVIQLQSSQLLQDYTKHLI